MINTRCGSSGKRGCDEGEHGSLKESLEASHSLKTYLHDHIAGAQHAIQLLEALQELDGETAVSQFAAEQLQQIKDDLAILDASPKVLTQETSR